MIDPTARISSSALIEADVEIGPNVIIGEHARIGSGTRIMANSVWPRTKLGNNNIHIWCDNRHDPQDFTQWRGNHRDGGNRVSVVCKCTAATGRTKTVVGTTTIFGSVPCP
jgi:acyl-[acyl carrier protein]--UDP-N-acetylglucosamine O-acyltransferase